MSIFTPEPADAPPPPAQLLTVASAHLAARCLHIIAHRGIADHIAEEPRGVDSIADSTGVDPDALNRILRILSAHGLFRHGPEGWSHTPASQLLRNDHPQSLRAIAALWGDPAHWESLSRLEHSLETGEPAAPLFHPGGTWGFYADNPSYARQFDAAMTSKSHVDIAELLTILDLAGTRTIADIAGGRGHYLTAILDAGPSLNGILFDQPSVIGEALRHPRMTCVGGDFFSSPMPEADFYLMVHILHDWSDAEALRILANLRRAAPAGARLALYELALPDANPPPFVLSADIIMLAVLGGRERTAAEYAALLDRSGWRFEGEVPTKGLMSLHLARAAD